MMKTNYEKELRMNSDLQPVEQTLCAPDKRLSTESVDALADPSLAAGFPCRQMQVAAITVDTTGMEVSGQKGICVQWR
jgi:hypothetical protein